MKSSLLILFGLMLNFCNAQTTTQTKDNRFDVNFGVSLKTIDSTLAKKIHILHFDRSIGVVFPAEYGKQKFGNTSSWYNLNFFTPDTILLKHIDTQISNQYCIAWKRFNEVIWDGVIDNLKEDRDKKSLRIAKRQRLEEKKRFKKFCAKWKDDLKYSDKQFIGFINRKGEKIIYIQFLDFRQDPYNLKIAFKSSWIDGWHGWFETNTRRLHFHIDKNLLTINEDL